MHFREGIILLLDRYCISHSDVPCGVVIHCINKKLNAVIRTMSNVSKEFVFFSYLLLIFENSLFVFVLFFFAI